MKNVIKVGSKIKFINDPLEFDVISASDAYAICTRKTNYRYDRGFIVDGSSWSAVKSEVVYCCVDYSEGKRGPHNSWGFGIEWSALKVDCDAILVELISGELELSRRNSVQLDIEYVK